jgi:hypothetical protein
MKNVSWNPHQKGNKSPSRSWNPKEFEEFAAAQQLFTHKKKKNRGKKRKEWWAKRQGWSAPSEGLDRKEETEVAPVVQSAEEETTVTSNDQGSFPFPPVPPAESSATPELTISRRIVPKAMPVGPQLPRLQIPRSPSLHGDGPGAMVTFPKGVTFWVPKEAMGHISSGMPGQKGPDFLKMMFPFPFDSFETSLHNRNPVLEILDDEDEVEGRGGSSSSRSLSGADQGHRPWKQRKS